MSKLLMPVGLACLFAMAAVQANDPLDFEFLPLTATIAEVPANTKVSVQYRVTNHSETTRTLKMNPIPGATQLVTKAGSCALESTLAAGQSCLLDLEIDGKTLTESVFSGPMLCESSDKQSDAAPFCIQPLEQNNRLQLQPVSADTVALGVKVKKNACTNLNTFACLLQMIAGSDLPSTITIVNPSRRLTAYNIRAVLPAYWSDVIQNSSNCLTLPPQSSCDLSFTPGIQPHGPALIPIVGTNTTTAFITMEVISPNITLTPSVSSLALSVACSASNPSCAAVNANLTGNQRIITIQNTGVNNATHVAVSSTNLPLGTTVSTTCNGTLSIGASCTVTIIPGPVASADVTNNACTAGTQPLGGVITLTADGGYSTQINAYVLGYGCIYQGGYIYSVNDTTPNTASISGTVAAINDSSFIYWDSSAGCVTPPHNACYITNANSGTNGTNLAGGNTYIIHQVLTVQNSELVNSYAAGLCVTSTMAGYNDWYLPAICEMGYNVNLAGINCGTQAAPTLQNMLSNLVDNGDMGGLSTGGNPSFPGYYWSSTEFPTDPVQNAFSMKYSSLTTPAIADKGFYLFGVRCSRILTA